MSDDLHDIDDLFKKALEKHTELPSSAVWDNIDKSLDKKKVISISKKYNKLKWAAAFLLLFSLSMAMYILHTGIRNKKLVRENNARGNLKDQAGKNLKDSVTEAKKIISETEHIKINEEPKKQESDDIAPVKPADVTAQNQQQAVLKTRPAIKIQEKPGGTGPANSGKKDSVESIVNNNHKDVIVNIQQQEKWNDKILSPEQKYIAEIPVITELKDRFQPLAIKPFSPIHGLSSNNAEALKYNKPVLQKHAIKKGIGSLLSATIFFSPDLVSARVKDDDPRFREDDRHEIEQDEKIKSSSTIGVLIDYNTGNNWILESGLTFSTRNNYIQPKTIYARPDNNGNINYRFNCAAGYSFISVKSAALPVAGDSIRALTSKNILQYTGVPVVVKYRLGKGRFSITPGIGISANFLNKGKIETTIATSIGNEGAGSNDIQGLKSVYFNGIASVGAEYKLNRRFALTFIPTARFALSSINNDAPVKTNLNSIGLAAGAVIKF